MPSIGSLFKKKSDVRIPLRDQHPTQAPTETKIRLAYLAHAMLDALGNPLQAEQRDVNRIVDEMRPHPTANRPAGVWTDDTSMMLCVSSALVTAEDPEENRVEQMLALRDWKDNGYLSFTGICFDLKRQVGTAIDLFAQFVESPSYGLHIVRSNYSGTTEDVSGNASLPRVLPLAVSFWREPDQARIYGKLSSEVTHPSLICKEASSLLAFFIAMILDYNSPNPHLERDPEYRISKLTFIQECARFPFETNYLLQMLTVPFGTSNRPEALEELEEWYFKYVPLLRLITTTQCGSTGPFPFIIPTEKQLPSTEHAQDTTLAALFCFFATKTFEEGALMAVNLCGEASTVGSVYAGLAGIWYAGEEGKAEKIFWTKRVREWRKALLKADVVDAEARKMAQLAWDRRNN